MVTGDADAHGPLDEDYDLEHSKWKNYENL